MANVRDALNALLSVCDGATSWDGHGFNKFDAPFAQKMSEWGEWSPKQEQSVYTMLRKYKKQLSHMGMEWATLERSAFEVAAAAEPEMDKPPKIDTSDIPYAEWDEVQKLIFLKSPYTFKDYARAIPSGRWSPEVRKWSYKNQPDTIRAFTDLRDSGRVVVGPRLEKIIEAEANRLGLKSQGLSHIQEMKSIAAPSLRVLRQYMPVNGDPYDHQIRAFEIARSMDATALLMEQGTGKTLPAIATMAYRAVERQVRKVLIVAPFTVAEITWPEELEKFLDLPYTLVNLTGLSEDECEAEFKSLRGVRGLVIALINYEGTWRREKLITKWKPDMIIADESQRIKNGSAKQ